MGSWRTLLHMQQRAPGGCYMYIHQMATLFDVNDVMATILKV